MHRLLGTVLLLAWGLWFGAIVMVFVSVTSLFTTFADQRPIAGAAAAGIFRRFEGLQLVAAAVSLPAAVGVRFLGTRTRAATIVAALLFLAATGALLSTFVLTPRIDGFRREGVPATSDAFKKLHRASSTVYTAQAALLLITGLLLPGVLPRRDTSAATAPA